MTPTATGYLIRARVFEGNGIILMRDSVSKYPIQPQNAEPMYPFPCLPFEAHQTGVEHDWQDEMGENDS